MADTYFSKLPTVEYNGQVVRDISHVVRMPDRIERNLALFHPYSLPQALRPDIIADGYYDDSHLEWLILLSNGIIDPYYGWYLNDDDLLKHVADKYGSVEDAQRRIVFWRNNWASDQQQITVSYYDNNLPESLRRYYTPVFGYGTAIIAYERRKVDWVVQTNKVIRLTIDNSEQTFAVGQLIADDDGSSGEVVYATDTTIDVKNVIGTFAIGNTIDGLEITNNQAVYTALDEADMPFWSPVSPYQIEYDLNESNRSIHLLDTNSVMAVSSYIRDIAKQ